MGLRRTIRAVNRDLTTMVARTPERRDRYVDFLRVLAIGVVVVWHWSLSILYWSGDRWVMPNPIGQVPGGWAATDHASLLHRRRVRQRRRLVVGAAGRARSAG